ncbi:MAG TPA: hypothetical protein VME24_12590 [Alphaproteobacteria bacterium]|nr:hypothetical protein [Alphaproteobacteria bacterium]
MSHRHLLILLGLVLIAIGIFERGWLLLAMWLGADFLALGIAHARCFHRVLGKRADGSLPYWSWLVFLPYLLYMGAVWHILRLASREPAQNEVAGDLVIGRRLLPREIKGEFVNYVDLTAEFPEPPAIRKLPGYLSFPVLDGAAPDSGALRDAINLLRPGRTFIHCAQGHGRSGLFTLAIMLRAGSTRTVAEGLEKLRAVRPGVQLSAAQLRCIDEFAAANSK